MAVDVSGVSKEVVDIIEGRIGKRATNVVVYLVVFGLVVYVLRYLYESLSPLVIAVANVTSDVIAKRPTEFPPVDWWSVSVGGVIVGGCIGWLVKRIARIRANLATVQVNLATIQTDMATVREDVTDIAEYLDTNLHQRVKSVETDVLQTVDSNFRALHERLEHLEKNSASKESVGIVTEDLHRRLKSVEPAPLEVSHALGESDLYREALIAELSRPRVSATGAAISHTQKGPDSGDGT